MAQRKRTYDPQRKSFRRVPEAEMEEHSRIESCLAQPQEKPTGQDASIIVSGPLAHGYDPLPHIQQHHQPDASVHFRC